MLGDAAQLAGQREADFVSGARVSLQGVFVSRGAGAVRVVSGQPIAKAQYCFVGNNISTTAGARSAHRALQTVTCEPPGRGGVATGLGWRDTDQLYFRCACSRRQAAHTHPPLPLPMPSAAAIHHCHCRGHCCRWPAAVRGRAASAAPHGSAGASWSARSRRLAGLCRQRAAASGRRRPAHCVSSLGGAGTVGSAGTAAAAALAVAGWRCGASALQVCEQHACHK